MENTIRKSVKACGLFASGMVAGFAASRLSANIQPLFPHFRLHFKKLSIPKIVPIIPEFDKELTSIELENQLRKNE